MSEACDEGERASERGVVGCMVHSSHVVEEETRAQSSYVERALPARPPARTPAHRVFFSSVLALEAKVYVP